MAAGLITLVAVVAWPEHAFPLTWIGVLLILDPINDFFGRPSLLGWLRRGDWSPLVCLGVGALICGWFWRFVCRKSGGGVLLRTGRVEQPSPV